MAVRFFFFFFSCTPSENTHSYSSSKNRLLTKDEMVAILKDIMLHNQPISNEFFLHSAQYEEVVFFILKKHKINYETLLFSYKYYVETTQITDLLEQVKAQMNEHKSTLE